MRIPKIVMMCFITILFLSVTALAADQKYATIKSEDGTTIGNCSLSIIWAWTAKDKAAATTMVDADSKNVARGVVASIFGYQNGKAVCSEYDIKEVKVVITAKGNCDRFKSFHALTLSGSSTTPLGKGSDAWLEIDYWKK